MSETSQNTPDERDNAFQLVYKELHILAKSWWQYQTPGQTLQPTALIHEAYIKLARSTQGHVDIDHFKALAATAMRQSLVDYSRSRKRLKRGGAKKRQVRLTGVAVHSGLAAVDIMAIDEAITRLDALHPRYARVVEMRFFAGMTEEEMARVLDVSNRTIRSDWRFARAWLSKTLEEGDPDE